MDTPAGESAFRVQLSEVYVLDGLSFNLSARCTAQATHRAERRQSASVRWAPCRLTCNGSSLSATYLPPSILYGGRTAVYGSPLASFPPISVEGSVPSPPPGFQSTI